MSDLRRRGKVNGFWGTLDASGNPVAAAVLANGVSNSIYLGEGISNFGIIVNVSGATTITLQAAHSSALTIDGNEPDHSTPPAAAYFAPVQWNGTNTQVVFSGAGSAYILVPQFVPGWVQLKSSAGANIWAGYEVVSD